MNSWLWAFCGLFVLGVFYLTGCSPDSGHFTCEIPEDNPAVSLVDSLYKQENLNGLTRLLDSLPVKTIPHAYATYRVGILKRRQGDVVAAVRCYKQAVQSFKGARPQVQGKIALLYHNIANFASNLDTVYTYATYSIAESLKPGCPPNMEVLGLMYHRAGNARNEAGDPEGGLFYLNHGVELCNSAEPPPFYVCAQVYTGHARCLHDVGELAAAKISLNQARELLDPSAGLYLEDSTYLADIYDSYVELADTEGRLAAATEAAKQSLLLNLATRPAEVNTGHSYNNLGRMYIRMGRFAEGEELLWSARRLYRANKARTAAGSCHENFAESKLLQGDTVAALNHLDSARLAYHGYRGNRALLYSVDKQELKDPLLRKARLELSLHASNPGQFSLARLEGTVASVDSIIGLLQYELSSEFSKREAIDELRTFYEDLVGVMFGQWERTGQARYHSLALRYLEQGKYRILREQQRRVFGAAQPVDDRANTELRKIEKKIAELKHQLRSEVSPDQREELRQAVNRLTLMRHQTQEALYSHSAVDYRSAVGTAALEQLSRTLPDGSVVLNYFLGDTVAFVAVATNRNVDILKMPWNRSELGEQVEDFVTAIKARGLPRWRNDREWREAQNQQREALGQELYAQLVGKLLPAGFNPSLLTFIPDGPLGYLPFEALVVPDPENLPGGEKYLVEECPINYEFSAGVWLDRSASPYQGATTMLTVSPEQAATVTLTLPDNAGQVSLAALSFAEGEVQKAGSFFRSHQQWAATAAERLREAQDFTAFGVLHFSGHAVLLPGDIYGSFLALNVNAPENPILLDMARLSKHRLDLELLVLSACQTGSGELAREEGIISLSRAGAAAGARSVIASLWEMNQESKVLFFEDFYAALAANVGRADALRTAKVNQLRGDVYAHPYFWAGFINTGSNTPLAKGFFR